MADFKALQVTEGADGKFASAVVQRSIDDLPAGEVLVRVQYSSLNYKDTLSASGNRRVTRHYPHTPGIDAAGAVVESSVDACQPGMEVIVSGYDLGMNTSGGFGQYIRVPAAWVVPLPAGLSCRESMMLGTAGFTAALCIEKLLLNGISVDSGEVLVTGASGGVGIVAVALLRQLGFQVVASTGKATAQALLHDVGAGQIIDRKELSEANPRPLLQERWAAAVDVVGGDTLCNVLKSLHYGGSAAACGLVQSADFQASVFPFILRGINLLGIDSVELPLAKKQAVWNKLAGDWKPTMLERICTTIGFDELADSLEQVSRGRACGRFLLELGDG